MGKVILVKNATKLFFFLKKKYDPFFSFRLRRNKCVLLMSEIRLLSDTRCFR